MSEAKVATMTRPSAFTMIVRRESPTSCSLGVWPSTSA